MFKTRFPLSNILFCVLLFGVMISSLRLKSNPPKFLIVKHFILDKHVGYFLHHMFSKIMFMICGGFLVTFKLEFVVVFIVVSYMYVYINMEYFNVLKLYYMYIFIY